MSTTIIFTVASLSILGLLLAVVLYFVAQKFKVEEDPRIDIVEAIMPGANCGGCGQAGCRAFAEACTKAENLDNLFCPVGGNATMKKVADALGFQVAEKAPMVAVVRCNGTCENRPKTNIYDGVATCAAKSALYSGDTGCRYGCVGCGDCVSVCNFGALSMDPKTGLPVVDEEKCAACGACVKACPKGVIELRNKGPKNRRVFVSCVSKDKGAVARKACKAACIGCGKCAKVCPFGAITVENNVAYIDFNKCKLCTKCVSECPTGAIHKVNFPEKPAAPAAPAAKPAEAPAPAEPIVAPGDKVKVGQLIANANGFISAPVHSSVSGTVKGIETVFDLAGNPCKAVVITVEGDEWVETIDRSDKIEKEIKLDSKEIIEKIKECGIVGLGGATFPTNVKLSPPPGKKAEFLIINGAECEPYLTSDYRVLIEMPEQVLIGAAIMMKALNVTQGFIGIEENKPEAIKVMTEKAKGYPQIKIVSLKKKYPQGGEKQLIDAVVGRKVPSMGLPIDTGAVVQNVGTALAVYEAVQKNKPLFEGILTVTGECCPQQKNYKHRVGTPLSKIIEAVGGVPEAAAKVISGGPMMGKAIANLDAPTLKGSSSVLFLTEEQTKRKEESNCIRCGKCIEACPMGLEPYLLNKLAKARRMDDLETNKIYDCIECGCCQFTCPAYIPLLGTIRLAKADVMKIMRSRPKK